VLSEKEIRERAKFCPVKDCTGHTPNVPMMRKILDAIRNNPNSWEQRVWGLKLDGYNPKEDDSLYFAKEYDPETDLVKESNSELLSSEANCGTAYCIAGYATYFSDQEFKTRPGSPYLDRTKDGYSVETYAQHELGLTVEEAQELFDGDNDWNDVKALMRKYAAIVGEEL
jgi:hypothetical protein